MNGLAWATGLQGLLLESCVVVAVVFAAGIIFGWLARGFVDGDRRWRRRNW